ncbi:hypothetical protein [Kouleothrix sp.]|uniref:hypothetical protein n=1 Tax=Kouleothrix sp. TaxID=2779161 RepID=UPI00391C7BAD
MNQEQKLHIENLQRKYQRRLQVLEEKQATYGLATPPETIIEIEEIQEKLRDLNSQLLDTRGRKENRFYSNTSIISPWLYLFAGGALILVLIASITGIIAVIIPIIPGLHTPSPNTSTSQTSNVGVISPQPISTIGANTQTILSAPSAISISSIQATPTIDPSIDAPDYWTWQALINQDFERAVQYADICISRYEPAARDIQQELIHNGTPLPPTGAVNASTKHDIDIRVELNNTGTCYFLKGTALAKENKIEEARSMYMIAEEFPYARTWDPSVEQYWSPAQRAKEGIDNLPSP